MNDQDRRSAEVPAGGRGADTGAVDAARIDEADEAELPNISSQNDIPGVGTRAADGSMEPDEDRGGDAVESEPEPAAPRDGAVEIDPDEAAAAADTADRPIEEYEPGVDPESARTSRIANRGTADDPDEESRAE